MIGVVASLLVLSEATSLDVVLPMNPEAQAECNIALKVAMTSRPDTKALSNPVLKAGAKDKRPSLDCSAEFQKAGFPPFIQPEIVKATGMYALPYQTYERPVFQSDHEATIESADICGRECANGWHITLVFSEAWQIVSRKVSWIS